MTAPALAELPEQVRARVVAMAAEVLPEVPGLPPAVRRVAGFAPARRARLGAGAIAEALADDELRHRVGTQVAARTSPDSPDVPDGPDGPDSPGGPGGPDSPGGPGGPDPVGVAALRWLVRPEGWEEGFADAVRRVTERPRPSEGRLEREAERLRGRLAEAEQAVRDLRAAHKVQLDEVKAENTALRRKLGDIRVAEKEARAAAGEAAEAARAADERASTLERENRRLRGQVERLEAEAARDRRDARSERDEATVRARVLLETVIDAAAGLRRELALPAVSGSPADRLEEQLAGAPAAGAATTTSGATSPAVLEQLLSMPRARLLLDGYNVSMTAWPGSALDAQRTRLVNALAPLVARTSAQTTVVFDAAETDHRPPVNPPRGVRVLFSPRGVIADDVLRDLVAAEPAGRVVLVVTGDQEVARDVARDGARVVAPEALIDLLSR